MLVKNPENSTGKKNCGKTTEAKGIDIWNETNVYVYGKYVTF